MTISTSRESVLMDLNHEFLTRPVTLSFRLQTVTRSEPSCLSGHCFITRTWRGAWP